MDLKGYIQLAYKSYWGSLLIVGVPFAAALFASYLFEWLSGTISISKLFRMFLACGLAGIAMAAFAYFALLRPLMRVRGLTYEDVQRDHQLELQRKKRR